MHIVSLNNGQNIVLFSENDVLESIGENFSYEIAEYLRGILWNQDVMEEYITDIEKDNSQLKALVSEYHNHNLWNDSYFDYLCETGRVQTMEV